MNAKQVFDLSSIARISQFITERENIRKLRGSGSPPPWTSDPALLSHSFCNINREHDAVTMFIAREFRPKAEGKGINYAIKQMLFCRIFNEPSTLRLACPIEDTNEAMLLIKSRKESGLKVFRGAYIMPAHEQKGFGAISYWFRALEDVQKIDFSGVKSLSEVASLMITVKGLGEFVINQICADLRYIRGLSFQDWQTFVLCGPGTRRGLNRIFGRPTKDHLVSSQATEEVLKLRETLLLTNPLEADHFKDPNNVSNSLCEFDKYERYSENPRTARLKKYGRNKNTQTELI